MTDHKPLLSLLNSKKAVPAQASARIQRWALTLAMYEYTLVLKNTNQHCYADGLPLKDTVDAPLPQETIENLQITFAQLGLPTTVVSDNDLVLIVKNSNNF